MFVPARLDRAVKAAQCRAMRIGEIEILPVVDGYLTFPTEAGYVQPGTLEYEAHKDTLQPDGRRRMILGGFLVRIPGSGRTILVDAGSGPSSGQLFHPPSCDCPAHAHPAIRAWHDHAGMDEAARQGKAISTGWPKPKAAMAACWTALRTTASIQRTSPGAAQLEPWGILDAQQTECRFTSCAAVAPDVNRSRQKLRWMPSVSWRGGCGVYRRELRKRSWLP